MRATGGKLSWMETLYVASLCLYYPPVRAGRAGTEIFIKKIFLDRNQMGEFVVSSCTRHTNSQKIDFLKISPRPSLDPP